MPYIDYNERVKRPNARSAKNLGYDLDFKNIFDSDQENDVISKIDNAVKCSLLSTPFPRSENADTEWRDLWIPSAFFSFLFGDNDAFVDFIGVVVVGRFGDADVVRFSGGFRRVGDAENFLLGEKALGFVGDILVGPIFEAVMGLGNILSRSDLDLGATSFVDLPDDGDCLREVFCGLFRTRCSS